jgi:hypothetical protein
MIDQIGNRCIVIRPLSDSIRAPPELTADWLNRCPVNRLITSVGVSM